MSATSGSVMRVPPILTCVLCSTSHNLRAGLLLPFFETIVNISYLPQQVNCIDNRLVTFLFGREGFKKLIGIRISIRIRISIGIRISAVLDRARVWRFVVHKTHMICEMCCQKRVFSLCILHVQRRLCVRLTPLNTSHKGFAMSDSL